LEPKAEYWSAFPLLKSFCCGKYPVINDKGALELAELCPTLLVIGDAVGFGTGWIVDRSEELEIFMYRRGDFHRLEAEEQARIATKRQAQNGGQRL
jgi:hypothetical protein